MKCVAISFVCLISCLFASSKRIKPKIKVTSPLDKVNVFSRGENGYFCIKIPDIILTQNGTLIAFGEARMFSCSDWTWTDLVYKKSYDNGTTWSELLILYSNTTLSTYKTENNTIGNAAPIQDSVTKRILVPFCRNNREVYLTYSDDNGESWLTDNNNNNNGTNAAPIGPLTDLVRKEWKWIGLGPPNGIQLNNGGRIIIAAYHSDTHLDGDLSKGHCIYSDDHGDTWQLSDGIFGISNNGDEFEFWPSESCAVELHNGSILINSRGTGEYRLQTLSNDNCNTFESSYNILSLRDQDTGCEGSMIRYEYSLNDYQRDYLYYSGLTPSRDTVLRYNMTLSVSMNEGDSWIQLDEIDELPSSYSALVGMPKFEIDKGKNIDRIGILYERSDELRVIFVPDHITFAMVEVHYSD